MKQIWKWIMHLDAKAFCLAAALLLCATTGWCMYRYMMPPESFKPGTGPLPKPTEPQKLGILGFVDDQVAGTGIVTPESPFRFPALFVDDKGGVTGGPPKLPEKGLTNTGGSQNNGTKPVGQGTPGSSKDNEIAMVTPKIAFLGFIKRSDESRVAMFADSSDNSTVFYTPGKIVHGLEILGADMREAQVRHPDGTVATIPIGGFIELTPEPANG